MLDRLYIAAGFLWLIAGMVFGIWIGINERMNYANSHAHINLLGFVVPVLFGIICHTWPAIQERKFAIVQFGLYQLGVVLLIAGKIDADGGGSATLAPPGSVIVVLATAWMAVMYWRASAARPAATARISDPV